MTEVFPAELTDQIIGYVDKTDKTTLLSCALVSRQWLPASRHALFHHVVVVEKTTLELLISRILHSGNALQLYLTVVRELYIGDIGREYGYANLVQGRDALARDANTKSVSHASHLFFFHFSGHLVALERMTLKGLNWKHHHTPYPYEPLLFSRFTSLRYIQLRSCAFPSFSFLRRALVAMPQLEQLSFMYVIWQPPLEPPIWTHMSTGPELRLLDLVRPKSHHGRHARSFIRWLSHTRSVQSLRDLCFSGLEVVDDTGNLVDDLLLFLDITSPHLLRLEIPLTKNLPLAQFRELEVLDVELLPHHRHYSWTGLCAELRVMQAPIVRLAISSVKSSYCGRRLPALRLDDEDFEELDALVMHFKYLRDLKLGVFMPRLYDRGDTRILKGVQARLPKSHRRDGFRVEVALRLDCDPD